MSFAASPGALPRHIAIIMDGNGRWAQSRGLPRIAGHRRGAEALRRTLSAASALTLVIFLGTTGATGDGERSLVEGLQRGAFEWVFVASALTVAWLVVRARRSTGGD